MSFFSLNSEVDYTDLDDEQEPASPYVRTLDSTKPGLPEVRTPHPSETKPHNAFTDLVDTMEACTTTDVRSPMTQSPAPRPAPSPPTPESMPRTRRPTTTASYNLHQQWEQFDDYLTASETEDDHEEEQPAPRAPTVHNHRRRDAIAGLARAPYQDVIVRARRDSFSESEDSEYVDQPEPVPLPANRKRKAPRDGNDGRANAVAKRRRTAGARRPKIHPGLNRSALEKMMEFLPKSLPLGTWDLTARAMLQPDHITLDDRRTVFYDTGATSTLGFDGRQLQSFWHGALTDWVKKISKQ